jgi:hypothetical protein
VIAHERGVELWGLPSPGTWFRVFWFIGTKVSEEGDSRFSVELYKTTRHRVAEDCNLDLTVVNFVYDFRTFGFRLLVRCLIALNIKRPHLCCVCAFSGSLKPHKAGEHL